MYKWNLNLFFHPLQTRSDVIYPWLPITLSCIIAFIIASCLIGVYEVIRGMKHVNICCSVTVLFWTVNIKLMVLFSQLCIDTIFVCFCEDCERNDGVQKPYYMSTGLMVSRRITFFFFYRSA